MNRILGVLAASFCVVAASPAAAQDVNPTTGSQTGGQEGFYGRVNVNANYLSLSNSENDGSIGGIGTGFSLAAGHSVMKNLYLFAEFNYDLALSPSYSGPGEELFENTDFTMNFLSVGPGAAYYLPSNIYLSAMVGYASVSSGADGADDSDAATGFGAKIGAGKEWAMADQFNLGVGANFFFGSVSVDNDPGDVSYTPMGFGLSLSGRYN